MLEIVNLTKTKIDTNSLQKAAQAAFAVFRTNEDMSLVLVGNAKMHALNKKYRGKNKATDVLSFEGLNEIFICLPQAKKQAKLLKTPLKTELMRLVIHGIVHLKGYDHEKSAREAKRMFALEDKILKNL
ncbi:MAG: rRNA maturation RNase YbeY [Candidatus Portnoybacteria bacterium]|nr:rRNA maturation RNase YbeY [Candidatus Portnoybacteria bacterium]MDD4982609.1 rRNA maturation RNase YbeY [Candidatus Portnoybacteria bacterium]